MKTLNEIKKILKKNKPYLKKKYFISELGIFGSFSRGNPKRNSDIDLLVSLKKPLGFEFVDLADELEILLNHKVDLVSKDAIKKRIFDQILNEIIYV
jgi:predicted nucleotidyltransferase